MNNNNNNPQDALTLIQYDDVYQDSEIIYAIIGKDAVQKRINIRITWNRNNIGFLKKYNLWTNVQVRKTKITPFPKLLDTLIGGKSQSSCMDSFWILQCNFSSNNMIQQERNINKL